MAQSKNGSKTAKAEHIRRKKLMDDPKMRYAYSAKKLVLHDKYCVEASLIPDSDFEMTGYWTPDMTYCHKCYRQALIRSGVNTEDKTAIGYYDLFFKDVSTRCVEEFFRKYHGEIMYLKPRVIKCKVKDDIWILDCSRKQKKLMHNNNRYDEKYRRHFDGRFHEQQGHWYGLQPMMRYTMDYSWEEHVEAYKAEAEAERIRSMNILQRAIYKIRMWFCNRKMGNTI